MWDLYDDSKVALPTHKLPPEGMPGIAWHQQGFYNSSDGSIHVPNITIPIEDAVAREMRHAYMAAVSWLDEQIGTVLDELEELGLSNNTIVLLHGDHGWQLGECVPRCRFNASRHMSSSPPVPLKPPVWLKDPSLSNALSLGCHLWFQGSTTAGEHSFPCHSSH